MLVVKATEKEGARIRRTREVDKERIHKMITFYQNFTDKCHHAKEERYYFPAAEVYDSESIAKQTEARRSEHTLFRGMLEEVDYLLGQEPLKAAMVAERLERYAELLRVHIETENQQLFPEGDQVLPASEEKAMLQGFMRIEKVELEEGFHQKYKRLAEELAGK